MPVRQVLESALTLDQSMGGGHKRFNHGQQMAVVHKLGFDGPQMAGAARDCKCGAGLVAIGFDQSLEAEAFQSLCDGAPVATQHFCGGLHIEPMLSEAI